jgi:hypothetical protein
MSRTRSTALREAPGQNGGSVIRHPKDTIMYQHHIAHETRQLEFQRELRHLRLQELALEKQPEESIGPRHAGMPRLARLFRRRVLNPVR